MVKKTAPKKTSKKNSSVEPVQEQSPPAPVPVPEVNEPANDQTNPIELQFQEILNDLNNQKTQIMNAINNVKKLQKDWVKEQKLSNKKKKKQGGNGKKREPSGFAKPTEISKDLCDFLQKPYGTEMARTEVTKYLTEYIRTNNLQWEQDKRKIIPDKKLKDLLNCGEGGDVTYFNLQKWMKPHFYKQISTSQ